MSMGIVPNDATGYVHSLTAEQEAKLRGLWTHVFKVAAAVLTAVYDVDLPSGPAHRVFEALDRINEPTVEAIGAALKGEPVPVTVPVQDQGDALADPLSGQSREQKILDRIDALMNNNDPRKPDLTRKVTPQHCAKLAVQLRRWGVHESEIKSVKEVLSRLSPEEVCMAILILVKQEHPDSLLLRFLRARRWDVGKAFSMMITNILWRKHYGIDDDILPRGELHALRQSRDEGIPAKEREMGRGVMAQLRMGKSFCHGFDRQGRPVNVVRVRIHQPEAQSEASLERYILHIIETTRLILTPPVETGTIVFDLTDFALSNLGYSPVKFIIKCFEANYPELLGLLLIHNAPWIFSSAWKLIHGWMDPVVASKVHFTKSIDDLSKFIARDQIPRELRGDEDWEYKYVEPDENENETMEDTATRDSLMYERMMIGLRMLGATASWISASMSLKGRAENNNAASLEEIRIRRRAIIEDFRQNYWKLDPFIRSRALVDRSGVLRSDGTVMVGAEVDDEIDIDEINEMGLHEMGMNDDANRCGEGGS